MWEIKLMIDYVDSCDEDRVVKMGNFGVMKSESVST